MAEYVVVDKEQLEADITTVADAIREKGGTSEQLPFPNGMADAVRGIQSGGETERSLKKILDEVGNCRLFYLSNFSELSEGLLEYSDTENVTSLSYMFANNANLIKAPLFDTRNALDATYMFQACKKLKEIPSYSFEKVTRINNMFQSCEVLETISFGSDLRQVSNMSAMFRYCSALKSVSEINMTSMTTASLMFGGCTSLEEVRITEGTLKKSLTLEDSPNLSDASIDSLVKGFADMTGQTSIVFTVHPTVKAKIEANQTWLSTLTSKNVTLA